MLTSLIRWYQGRMQDFFFIISNILNIYQVDELSLPEYVRKYGSVGKEWLSQHTEVQGSNTYIVLFYLHI